MVVRYATWLMQLWKTWMQSKRRESRHSKTWLQHVTPSMCARKHCLYTPTDMQLLMRPARMLPIIFVRVLGLWAPINVVFILALFWLFGMAGCFLQIWSLDGMQTCWTWKRRFWIILRYREASKRHAKVQGLFLDCHTRLWNMLWAFSIALVAPKRYITKHMPPLKDVHFTRSRQTPFEGGWGNDDGIDYQTMEETFFIDVAGKKLSST